MEKRRLGKTNLEVSVIGFGGIPIQRVDEDLAIKLLKESYNKGINFIDTARGYNQSEELIGTAVEKIGRENFVIATKSMKRDYMGMKEDVEISLKNLKTDYIDLYQFHNVRSMEELNTITSDNGALKALKEAKEKGLIKEIGITGHTPEILEKALELGEFSTVQCPYNPVERQAENLFKKANDMEIGVIVMKPLAGGAITKGELSLRFIVDNPNVTVAIPGMESIEQINENSLVGIDMRKLTKEEEEELFGEANSLGAEFCRRCGYCLPCPQGIDIPVQFLMEGYYTRYNLKDWAQERYDAMENRATNCVECGQCEPRCPYNLPIRKMLKNVVEKLG